MHRWGTVVALVGFFAFSGVAQAYGTCPGDTTPQAYLATRPALTVFPLAQSGSTGIYVGGDTSTTSPYGIVCDFTNGFGPVNAQAGNFHIFSPVTGTGGQSYFGQSMGDIFAIIFSTSNSSGGDDTAILFFTVDGSGLVWPLSNPPVVSGVSITSNNALTTLAKPGDAVTLTFASDSSVQTPAVTIAGHTAAVATTTGNNFTASTTLSSGDTEGIVPFTIQLTNYFGNTGFTVSTTSDNSAITFDKTAPTLAEVTPIATSTNTTPSYSFTTTEAGTISYGGSCSSATTAAITPTTTIAFNTLAVGTHSDCTITVTDAAGNASAALAVTPFEIDAPPPAPAPAQSGGGGTITGSGPLSYGYQQPAPAAVIPQEPTPTPAPAPAPEESPAQGPATQAVSTAESPAQVPSQKSSGLLSEAKNASAGQTFAPAPVPGPVTPTSQAAAIATAPVPGFHPSPWLLVALPAVGGLWWGGRKFFGYTMRP